MKSFPTALCGFFVALLLITSSTLPAASAVVRSGTAWAVCYPVDGEVGACGVSIAQENDGDVPGKCGVERWGVKTLVDSGSAALPTAPVDTTVYALRALPVPAGWNKNSTTRYRDGESTLWRVTAVLVGWKLEADKDFHIVIRDPNDAKGTMIVEPPDPSCSTSAQRANWGHVRAAFVQCFGNPTPRFRKFPPNMTAVLTGYGFFDLLHSQTGVAPNGIELHPLQSVKTLPGVKCPKSG